MQTKKTSAYLTCEKFSQDIYIVINKRYKSAIHEDVIVVEIDKGQQIILFSYGIFVCWNISFENLKFFQDHIKSSQIESFKEPLIEEFDFISGEDFNIKLDTVTLDSDDILEKIAISHSVAQNLKLNQFENKVQSTIEANSSIPAHLAQKGDIPLSRKEIAKTVGELFLVKSQINLHYDLLDTPEFFWEYPEYEVYYERMIKYLDIKPRVEVLNKKVEVIQELLNVLSNEQNHRHASFLEWIIIILIAFEIIMNLIDHYM